MAVARVLVVQAMVGTTAAITGIRTDSAVGSGRRARAMGSPARREGSGPAVDAGAGVPSHRAPRTDYIHATTHIQSWPHLPLAGLVDIAEEEKRLQKEIAKVQKDVDLFAKKLSNEKFVANAPSHVLEKDRGKLKDAEEKRVVLLESLEKIQALK